jgi:hypothetical protein
MDLSILDAADIILCSGRIQSYSSHWEAKQGSSDVITVSIPPFARNPKSSRTRRRIPELISLLITAERFFVSFEIVPLPIGIKRLIMKQPVAKLAFYPDTKRRLD